MDAGLKKLLDAIVRTPSTKMVERFLALIADYQDEVKKAKTALHLAKALLPVDASEAMRIAHMVYKWDRENIAALDIVIEGLKVRGRHGKAEVLALERNKLVKHMENTGASQPGAFARIEVSQVLELDALAPEDAGPDLAPVPKHTAVAQHLAPQKTIVRDWREDERLPAGVVAQSIPPEGDERRKQPLRARESMPIHVDIMQGHQAPTQKLDDLFAPLQADPPGNAEDAVDLLFAEPAKPTPQPAAEALVEPVRPDAKTVKLADAEPQQLAREQVTRMAPASGGETSRSPSLSLEPSVVKPIPSGPAPEVHASDLGVAVEMFDYYWQQGFVDEAGELLEQTSKVAGDEPWWRARNDLLLKSKPLDIKKPAEPSRTDFWGEINQELGKLASRIDLARLVPQDRETMPEPLPPEAWEALLRVLRPLEAETPDQTLTRQWEIISGLWADHPHPECAHLLETLGLQRATTGFWGVYLDSLLVGRKARRCLEEIRTWLPEKPRLLWCNTAYERLVLVWHAMEWKTFPWCEDDGVWPLLKHLAERPRPKMRSMIVMGDHKAR